METMTCALQHAPTPVRSSTRCSGRNGGKAPSAAAAAAAATTPGLGGALSQCKMAAEAAPVRGQRGRKRPEPTLRAPSARRRGRPRASSRQPAPRSPQPFLGASGSAPGQPETSALGTLAAAFERDALEACLSGKGRGARLSAVAAGFEARLARGPAGRLASPDCGGGPPRSEPIACMRDTVPTALRGSFAGTGAPAPASAASACGPPRTPVCALAAARATPPACPGQRSRSARTRATMGAEAAPAARSAGFLPQLCELLRCLDPEGRRSVIARGLTQRQRAELEAWMLARRRTAGPKAEGCPSASEAQGRTRHLGSCIWGTADGGHMACVHLGHSLHAQSTRCPDLPSAVQALGRLLWLRSRCWGAPVATPGAGCQSPRWREPTQAAGAFAGRLAEAALELQRGAAVQLRLRSRVALARGLRLSTPLRGDVAGALRDWE
ncbi:unnamed protein product, partial [Prorocentrum cordatum]